MPELTHDTAEDGFHEIQLSGKQLVFLFMATTVVSVVIFLCGVLVGRNVREPEAPIDSGAVESAPAAESASEPLPSEPPAPVVESELTYHERLQQQPKTEQLAPAPKEPAEAPKPEPPPPAQAAENSIDVPTSGRPGTWVLQVQALQNRSAASAMVQRLISKGYPAFLSLPPQGEPRIYRVQIGRYKDRREAEEVARRLEKEEQSRPDIKR